MSADFALDPAAPVFMVSYARQRAPRVPVVSTPAAPDGRVSRFFADLSTDVGELLGLGPGRDPGFMDMTMRGGQDWRNRLLYSAGSCQILICLLGPRYLNGSEWCPMEFEVFSRRDVMRWPTGDDDIDTAIIPLIWIPTRGEMPKVIADLGRFSPRSLPDPAFLDLYLTNGLYGLIGMGQKDAYQSIVWKIAMYMRDIYTTLWVRPDVPPGIDGLPRTFADVKPRGKGAL